MQIPATYLLVGDPYRLLISGEQTGGAFAWIESVVSPGMGPPPHRHERESETFYIVEGEITFYTDAGPTVATAGSAVHMPRNEVHTFKNTGAAPARMLVQVTPAGAFDRYLQTVGLPVAPGYVHQPAAPSPEHIAKVLAEGPNFGIHFVLP
jgi:quercetin dioxygenase-like cupin family protein